MKIRTRIKRLYCKFAGHEMESREFTGHKSKRVVHYKVCIRCGFSDNPAVRVMQQFKDAGISSGVVKK